MGKTYDGIDQKLAAWLADQAVFFVGTAPLAGDGLVNVSPKGMRGCFAVLGPHQVAYLDFTGSGAETVAHLRENGRIVLIWSIPLMDYRTDRDILDQAGARKEAEGKTREYWATRNARSIDGLPALSERD